VRLDSRSSEHHATGLTQEVLASNIARVKEQLKRLKKDKAKQTAIDAQEAQIREQEKAARDLEAQALAIDAAVFDLKAVNPHVITNTDERTPVQIIQNIEAQGRIVAGALTKLSELLNRSH